MTLVKVNGQWNIAIRIIDPEKGLTFMECKDKNFSVKNIPIEQLDPTNAERKKHLPPELQNLPLSYWWDGFTEPCSHNFPVKMRPIIPPDVSGASK